MQLVRLSSLKQDWTKEYSQIRRIDYEEIFSPVVWGSTIKLLTASAVEHKLNIEHLDVESAFLNGILEETIYMSQPKGFEVKGGEHKVCLLKKSIYGLKQASRLWNKTVHKGIQLNYVQSKYEPCVYFKIKDKKKSIITLYVDDFFIFSNDDKEKF